MKKYALLVPFLASTLSTASAQSFAYKVLNAQPQSSLVASKPIYSDVAPTPVLLLDPTTDFLLWYEGPFYIWNIDRYRVNQVGPSVLADLVNSRNQASGQARIAWQNQVTAFCNAMQRLQPKGYTTNAYGNPATYKGEFMALHNYDASVEIKAEVRFIPPQILPGTNGKSNQGNRFANSTAVRTFTYYKK